MMKIKLPFGVGTDGTVVHITEVDRGRKCACFCPHCKSTLIAAKGPKNQHHFRHEFEDECRSGLESAIHLAAKKIIAERKQLTLPKLVFRKSKKDSKGVEYTAEKTLIKNSTIVDFDFINEEVPLQDIKADIMACKGNSQILAEIYVTHKVDEEKKMKIESLNLSAIEIDLSNLKPDDVRDWESFWRHLNNPERIRWLNNIWSTKYSAELEAELDCKIEEQEKKYQKEQKKREEKEKKDQENLLKAIKELKILRDEEYKSKLRERAIYDSLLKRTCWNLPFDWDVLPSFLNLEVPDGDWIYGCDRRVWQTAFVSYFICKNEKAFNTKNVDKWLQNTMGYKVFPCVKLIGIYRHKYKNYLQEHFFEDIPSTWKTLNAYFEHLCDLGILRFSGYESRFPGSCWFEIQNKDLVSIVKKML